MTAVCCYCLQFLVFTLAGWLNRQQQDLIDYLREENWILREQLGGRRLRPTDEQRRRLALRGKALGRKALSEMAGIVTPDSILRWYRGRRRVKIAGIYSQPYEEWMEQTARNLTDGFERRSLQLPSPDPRSGSALQENLRQDLAGRWGGGGPVAGKKSESQRLLTDLDLVGSGNRHARTE